MKKNLETICVHGGWKPKKGEPQQLPICQSTTFRYETSEQMARLFDLKDEGYFYTRLANPTNDAVAKKICALEGGVGAMLTSSGQAANFYAVFNICQAGDHFITSNTIYGGTFNLFGVTMKKLGIECTFVDPDWDDAKIEACFKENTKCFFGETISNPGGNVFDIERFAKMAHKHGVPLIVDNTFATPINCRPFEWGCDIVTHSTTKYMDGHATQVGGCIVDSGNFNWETCTHEGDNSVPVPVNVNVLRQGSGEQSSEPVKFPGLTTPDESYHGLTYTKAFGKMAYTTKLVAQLMRDLGSIPAPQNSFLLNLGLETLALRMKQHCSNAQKVAEWLEKNPKVSWVNYCGLPSNKYYALAQKYMPNGSCGVIAFGLKGTRDDAIKFMDNLDFISIVTHVADARTCVLHPASHTHRQLSDEQLREAGVAPDLVRLSVGIENVDDIIADLESAMKVIDN
ncbi:MAG: aminotransferase class V-fold PLP-dependent enzyme [Prevotella sp.]|nr:aminotransferase class V-fold PLP-dependent enzyme [Prevotella sp.]